MTTVLEYFEYRDIHLDAVLYCNTYLQYLMHLYQR